MMMTDGQFATLLSAIVAFFGSLIGTVKWSAGRITKAIDDASTSQKEASREFVNAQLEQAKALREQSVHFAQLSEKIDAVTDWVHEHTPVEEFTPIGRYHKKGT
jgi:hypothetical protein